MWLGTNFATEVIEECAAVGLVDQRQRYFAARVAPMGAVPVSVVASTFYNFNPVVVAASLGDVWTRFTPAVILAIQHVGVERALARMLSDVDSADVQEAAALMRTAAEAASGHTEGRPLFSGYASLPWPRGAQLELWHAHYLLREFRSDGHIAVLVASGLSAVEALILHVAMMPVLGPIFRPSRAWTDEQWSAALDRLRADDWLTEDEEPTLTSRGRQRRVEIEHRTNDLNVPAYETIGPDGCGRLLALGPAIKSASSPLANDPSTHSCPTCSPRSASRDRQKIDRSDIPCNNPSRGEPVV